MITIDTTADKLGEAIQGVFDRVSANFAQVTYVDVLNQAHRDLESEHRALFASAVDPNGAAWKPLAPATIARKGHATILVDTSRLRRSLQGRSDDSIRETIIEGRNQGLVFGTGVPYSHFHQSGGAKLPQRAHVGVTRKFLGEFGQKVATATVRKLKERST